MSTHHAQFAQFLTNHHPELTNFCARLVQTPSVNGVHNELAVAELVAQEAAKLGLSAQILGAEPQRPNVVISTGDSGPTGLLLVGHLDTVPEGDPAQWTHPPFSGHITNGKLFGRGAIDNKGGIASALYALAAIASINGALPHGRVQLICVPDEESGATGTLGVKYLARQGLVDALGAIYVYPGADELPLGHRGVTRFKLVAHGLAAHTGLAGRADQLPKGHNAVTAMADLLLQLEQFEPPRSTTEYFDQFRAAINPGTVINGGTNVNIVPDTCEALVDIRTIPEFDRPEAENLLEQLIVKVTARRPGIHFDIELLTYLPPALSNTSAPLFDIVQRVASEVNGITPRRVICGPANEGYLFIEQDIPIVCGFGPVGANAHAIDEYIEIDSLVSAALIYALAAIELLK